MDYDYTKAERQKRFNERRYKAGLKKIFFWVKRTETKAETLSIASFTQKFRQATKGWDKDKLSSLLNLFLKITKAKKEEGKLKNIK